MPRPTTTGVFHQYLEMIGANEPMTHRARFWSSYVRGLGGITPRRIYLKCLAIERANSRVYFCLFVVSFFVCGWKTLLYR